MAKSERELIGVAIGRARGRQALVRFLATSAGGLDVYAVGSTADVDQAYTVTVKGSEYRSSTPGCSRAPRR